MASSTIFSFPVTEHFQQRSKRKLQYQPKKRKRAGTEEVLNRKRTGQEGRSRRAKRGDERKRSLHSEYTAVLTPDERSQYRLAGQPLVQELPKKPFPHAPLPADDDRLDSEADVRPLISSIITSDSAGRSISLRHQHLGSLIAILHRSLSEQDYGRAERAFSLLLRDEFRGHTLDVRTEGRWGIGAEILLRQGANKKEERPTEDVPQLGFDSSSKPRKESGRCFTRKGFEDAKAYYERLIVQYPFRKANPNTFSSLDFYLAMFGLWIYVAHEEGKPSQQYASLSDLADSDNNNIAHDREPASHEQHASKLRELEQAREIANRMDACMSTLPYSDDVELIRLRAMVALWIADLIEYVYIEDADTDNNMDSDWRPVEALADGATRVTLKTNSPELTIAMAKLESTRSRQKATEMLQKLRREPEELDE